MTDLKITSVETEGGKVFINLESNNGAQFRVPLNSADTMSLMHLLSELVNDAVSNSEAESAFFELHHVQFQENSEMLYFRAYVNDQVFHEYSVPQNTTLSVALKALVETYEAESMGLAVRQAPRQTKN